MPLTTQKIRDYYDRNTSLFLRFGSSDRIQTIHRALWRQGVRDVEAALNVSNEMVLDEARKLDAQNILDLGCGVGATLFYILSPHHRFSDDGGSWRGVGLTLSFLQAQLAARAAEKSSLPKTHILQADFQSVPLAAGFDLAYSIEAFVHATEPERYLSEVARILRPSGRLVILDDFLPTDSKISRFSEVQQRESLDSAWLKIYQTGWHAPNLRTPAEIGQLAAGHSLALIENRDLTSLLHLRALPNWLARLLVSIFKPFWCIHPIIPSMLGSMALQQCLSDGLVEYRWLVFQKHPSPFQEEGRGDEG
jgi:cyclopropane fatty-acyl-phospholipid synthase-like methyltransferase